jgi:hypothetical protein
LKADKAAVDKVEGAFGERYGKEFPGANALWCFRARRLRGAGREKNAVPGHPSAAAAGEGKLERRPSILRKGAQVEFRSSDHGAVIN